MKQILLPTDFSENSKKAIFYALDLYGTEDVRYTLLNTYFVSSSRAQMATHHLRSEMEEYAEVEMKKLKEEILERYSKASIRLRDEYGTFVDVISSFGKRDFDLIVMGTKGASGLKQVFLGSNTWDAIEEVQLPLIAVPEDAVVRPLKKIVIAIDRKEFSSKAKFEELIGLAKRNNAEVTILHVGLSNGFVSGQKQQVAEWFQGVDVHFAWTKDNDVEHGIHEYSEQHGSDLVVLINRKKSFWESLFHSSVTKKVAFHTDVPLFALHD